MQAAQTSGVGIAGAPLFILSGLGFKVTNTATADVLVNVDTGLIAGVKPFIDIDVRC
ncbi:MULTISPECIES: hypothetical protein [Paenibacillus]|uniref:hypothetical protein n=1 Tax=Paenibacillus TaxID=44249 RepID=UPI000AF6D244|nr:MULTISPECIES: hypothetical protein [Paenibacillus]